MVPSLVVALFLSLLVNVAVVAWFWGWWRAQRAAGRCERFEELVADATRSRERRAHRQALRELLRDLLERPDSTPTPLPVPVAAEPAAVELPDVAGLPGPPCHLCGVVGVEGQCRVCGAVRAPADLEDTAPGGAS